MSSFSIFTIKYDGNQTSPYDCNITELHSYLDKIIGYKSIEKIVIKKNFI